METLPTPAGRADPVPPARELHDGLPFLTARPEPTADEPSFHDWIRSTFGEGFARHFFDPYNAKLWRSDLREVTGDWVSWSIPRPELADVLRGAIGTTEKAFGYNPDFLYPSAGGIDALPRAIAEGLPAGVVRTDCQVEALEAGAGRVKLADGGAEQADVVLTSLPLPVLARITHDLPEPLREAAGSLCHVSIRVINLGVRGEPVHPGAQWVYVPSADAPFHRIGLPAALTPAMAPAGHHSLVAEISFRPDDAPDRQDSLDQTLRSLLEMGFLRDRADVVQTEILDIPEAYVVFDRARRRIVPQLLSWYVDHDVIPMGRYGTWDYLAMEDSLVHGRQAARWIGDRRS
jgi:protoporphyrinogen oxidase